MAQRPATRKEAIPTRKQPGRHALSPDFVAMHQRQRIMRATAEAVAERGYQATTVAQIVRAAHTARNTFYETFSSKEEALLATFDWAAEESIGRVTEAYASTEEDSWSASMRVGLKAFLDYIAEEPALARLCLIEAISAGPAAIDRYEATIQRFAKLFRLGRRVSDKGSELPATTEETIVGGIVWIIYQRLAAGEAEKVPQLLPEIVEFALTPYRGRERAKLAAEAPDATQD